MKIETIKKLLIIVIVAIAAAACGSKKSRVFIVDFSDSVSVESREKSFEAMLAEARKLGRGDSITVIPITGDALVETGGKVVEIQASEIRKLRDRDLKDFRAEIERRLGAMQSDVKIYGNTDLLGAMRAANEITKNLAARNREATVIVLSDLVHSTPEIRFEKDSRFADPKSALAYGAALDQKLVGDWRNAEVYLGTLESSDLRAMPAERRAAVREFWESFFKRGNAKRIVFATDGPGQIPSFTAPPDAAK